MPAESVNRQRFRSLLKEINNVVENEDEPLFLLTMRQYLTEKIDEKIKKVSL